MVEIDYIMCDKCATCISVCKANALTLQENLYCEKELCTKCGKCVRVCPFGALKLK